MGAVKDLIKKVKAETKPAQEAAILDILSEHEKFMIDLNRSQLMEGTTSEEGQLIPYRSESYARMKASLNSNKVTDLRLTGAFHRSFVAITDKWPVIFSASNSKMDKLVTKYGEDIFGLDTESKALLAKNIQPEVIEYYRKVFQL